MEGERRKKRLWPWLAAFAVLGGLLVYNYWPVEPEKIIISRETTYILGPLNPDGTVNYVKYLDDKHAEGVTAANNAAPLLLRAFGPEMLPDKIRAETLRRLNLPADIFDHDKHLIEWKNRARPGKAAASGAADANDANSPTTQEQAEDESEDEPNINEVYEMLLAGQVHPDLEAWLASNADPLELVCQATAKDKFYMPLVSTSTPPRVFDVQVPTLQWLQQAALALTARATLKMMHNDPRGAWEDVLVVHRLARLMGKDSPTLVQCLVAVGLEGMAGKAGIVLATRGPMGAVQAREVLGKLNALSPATDMVRAIDEGERFLGLDVVLTLTRPGGFGATGLGGVTGVSLPDSADLDWNKMLRDMNAQYDQMVKPLRLPRFQGRGEAKKAYDDEFKAFATQAGSRATPVRLYLLRFGGRLMKHAMSDLVSDILVCTMMPSLATACDLEEQAKMTHEIETLAVALACFHGEHGRWPAELKELCPSLLKAIPADRFSVKPLIYRPGEKGYLLYSVGRNLRDDGAQREPRASGKSPDEKKDDIVAEVKPERASSKPAASQP